MRLVIQRVREASVTVNGQATARIGAGLVVLVGFTAQDTPRSFLPVAERLVQLRIFDDHAGRMNRSLLEVGGELLIVPEITLAASLDKGHRPHFDTAASPILAQRQFEGFVQAACSLYPRVAAGVFRAQMLLHLVNDGPVTFVIDPPLTG